MKNVLVFPCGSEIGLEINRLLSYSRHFKIFGASSVDDHGKFAFRNYIPNLPFIGDDNFLEELNKIIAQYDIDYIFPAHDDVVMKLSLNTEKLKAEVIISPAETCVICRSKKKTYQYFENIIPTPKIFNTTKNIGFPVFLKPDIGQGSKGTYKANSFEEVLFQREKDKTLLILEYLPGKEYTIDCFTDRTGKLLFIGGRERSRISNGISIHSKICENKIFKKYAEKINANLKFQGAWFFQVKERANGELVLLEIAPRIAGGMEFFSPLGINFPQITLFDRMGSGVTIIRNELECEMDRALYTRYSLNLNFDTIYVDYDDVVIVENNVNPMVIAFLYQAKNRGKEIILITKHKGNLQSDLANRAISIDLFDHIFQLDQAEKKSSYITKGNAILIDDSFSERKDVHEKAGIFVFGIECIEALFNSGD